MKDVSVLIVVAVSGLLLFFLWKIESEISKQHNEIKESWESFILYLKELEQTISRSEENAKVHVTKAYQYADIIMNARRR